jgi:hypothetical protein
MSRQAKSNPLSTQFRGDYPDQVFTCGTTIWERPDDLWLFENPGCDPLTGKTAEGELPPNDRITVSMMATIQRTEPSNLHPGDFARWPKSGEIPLGPVLAWVKQPDGEMTPLPMTMTKEQFIKLTPIAQPKIDTFKGKAS